MKIICPRFSFHLNLVSWNWPVHGSFRIPSWKSLNHGLTVTYFVFGRDITHRVFNLGMLLFLRFIDCFICLIFLCGLPIFGHLSRDGPRSELSTILDILNSATDSKFARCAHHLALADCEGSQVVDCCGVAVVRIYCKCQELTRWCRGVAEWIEVRRRVYISSISCWSTTNIDMIFYGNK